MRRRNVPCSPCSGGSSSGDCCSLKEKLRILWDRTIGSILRINGISPDGDGDFAIEAGSNIAITERGTGNGIRIDTTGGVSYYSSGDSYVNVDNNDLKITVNVGTGGLATDTDLQTVAGAVSDILDGTTTIPKATEAQYLGNNTSNVGDDSQPVKIVNGQAVAINRSVPILEDLTASVVVDTTRLTTNSFRVTRYGKVVSVYIQAGALITTENDVPVITNLPEAENGGAMPVIDWSTGTTSQLLIIYPGSTYITKYGGVIAGNIYQTLTYICK